MQHKNRMMKWVLVVSLSMLLGCNGTSSQRSFQDQLDSSDDANLISAGYLSQGGGGSGRLEIAASISGTVTVNVPATIQLQPPSAIASGTTARIYWTQSSNVPAQVTEGLAFYAYLQSHPNIKHQIDLNAGNNNQVSYAFPATGNLTALVGIFMQQKIYYTVLLQVNVQTGSSGGIITGIPIVPDSPDGYAPFALIAVPNDSGSTIPNALLKASVPAPVSAGISDNNPWLIYRYTPAANTSQPGTLAEVHLAQGNAIDRYARQNLAQTATTRPTHNNLVSWSADLNPTTNYFALYQVASNNPTYVQLLQANPFVIDPTAQQILNSLTVRHYGPHGDRYDTNPASQNQKVYYSGPVTKYFELNGITKPVQGSNPLPHGIATKVFAKVKSHSPVVEIEIAIMNGFMGQQQSGGWNNLPGSKTMLAASNMLYADKITVEFPIQQNISIVVDQPQENRNTPQDLFANGITLHHAGTPGQVFPIKDFAYLARTLYVGPANQAALLNTMATQPLAGMVIPAKDVGNLEINSYRKIPFYAGIPISKTDPTGTTQAQFDTKLQQNFQNRIANAGPPAQSNTPQYGQMGTLQVFNATLNGGTTGGTWIGTLFPDHANTIRGQSIWGLRLAKTRFRDQSDQGAYVMFNALENDPRAFQTWRADYGLIQKYAGDSTWYQPITNSWDMSVATIPNFASNYWKAERDTFAATAAYQAHIAGLSMPSWKWYFDKMKPHDHSHESRNRDAHFACLALGMPTACYSIKAIADQDFEARTLVPWKGPLNASNPWGYTTGFTLLKDKTSLHNIGPGKGGFITGRQYGWTFFHLVSGLWLETDDGFLSYKENHAREELKTMLAAMIGDYSNPNGQLAVPGMHKPYNKDSFVSSTGGANSTFWYEKVNYHTQVIYAAASARDYFKYSSAMFDQQAVSDATHNIWNLATFIAHQAWRSGGGGPGTGAPYGLVAVSGKCWTVNSCAPQAPQEWLPADPSPNALVYQDNNPANPSFYRNAGSDPYYMSDAVALLAVETGDVTASNKVKNQNNKSASGYGVTFAQLFWWFTEMGMMP